MNMKKLTGVAVPLGAMSNSQSKVLGQYTTLGEFAKFCKKCDIGLIQLLPVNDTGTGNSPYSGLSAFALHPIYIDISALDEWASATDETKAAFKKFEKTHAGAARYNYTQVLNEKESILRKVYETTSISKSLEPTGELCDWMKNNEWITSYCVYKNLKQHYKQASWKEWKKSDTGLSYKDIQKRWDDPKKKSEHLFYAWEQFVAYKQFKKSCDEVRELGIVLKGDMPILMNEDSCDAWASPDVFNQSLRAGSPVDNENPTGQNWGFPTYNWQFLKSTNYDWWKKRLKVAEQFYSAYRLDHILGFFRIWAIPVRDTTAILGHTEPYVPITRDELHNSGFNDERIRWLSQPHIPTGAIEDITWNHGTATAIMEKFATRINNEELWLFKKEVTGDKDFYESDLKSLTQGDADVRVKQVLSKYWCDRALIEITPNNFVPVWTYAKSTSYKSLNWGEQNALNGLINNAENEQNKLWESQSSDILQNLTKSVNMVPCGEDLGAELPCLPGVMARNGILSLRVYRWCRNWKDQPIQPYIQVGNLPELSVTTTSVHDSSTLRGWWTEDKSAAILFVRTYPWAFGLEGWDNDGVLRVGNSPYTCDIAKSILKVVAGSSSFWCIHPLQDFLALSNKYWAKNADDERVNVPGTVSDTNWTYKIPCDIETLNADFDLIAKIKEIADMHK